MNDKKREEQIKEAARQRADQYDHPSQWSDTYYGFIDGAHWADSHPNWISVEDELPKEKGAYLFHFDDGQTRVEGYFPDVRLSKCVTHWAPLPQPPEEEEEI
jgi:hypothetical protein